MQRDINRSIIKRCLTTKAAFDVNRSALHATNALLVRIDLRQPRVITNFKQGGVFQAAAYFGVFVLGSLLPSSTETAVANGDTRTLSLYHSHTGESIDATFRVNGAYDPAVLEKLNWFLRDWRNNDRTKMDPRLFDVVWETYRSAGANEPIVVVSAYRSPETNAMLRRRSRAVAEHSQHILGKAMDTTMPGMSMEKIRELGMRLQRGGVGYYGNANFVHLDVGNVRHWPRMSYDQLARLFPDGKTVHLASNGRTLPRYEEARAEIAARGGVTTDAPASSGGNFFAWLFGNHDQNRDQEEDAEIVRSAGSRRDRTRVAGLGAAAPGRSGVEQASVAAARGSAADDDRVASAPKVASTPKIAVAPSPERELDQASSASKTVVASLGGATSAIDAAVADNDAEAASGGLLKDKTRTGWLAAAAPLPPSRPLDLVAVAEAPLPPSRPQGLDRVAALPASDRSDAGAKPAVATNVAAGGATQLARAASLPVVITQGPKDQAGLPTQVLAYADGGQTPRLRGAATGKDATEAERTTIVSARPDHANLPSLTGDVANASAPTPSFLGQALTGLRQAARIIPDALSNLPTAGLVSAFRAVASELDSAHFSAQATKQASEAANVADGSSPSGK
ncbi:DUF882 domain-containing protein [Methylocapsa acidiphila]|uniref:DUF882 domain-containing protein n=1 Tax=Methylocapsa acidiphila TaxID=133552 RepID=UPI000A0519BC|nr:DUF882 domain-containing protein [Methylocapsa acidiphila]